MVRALIPPYAVSAAHRTHNNKTSMRTALSGFLGIAVQFDIAYAVPHLFRMIAVYCFDFWLTIRQDTEDMTRGDEVTNGRVLVSP